MKGNIYTFWSLIQVKIYVNRKVLLRERKRHTTCRIASARYADGGGVPHPVLVGGVPHPVMVGGLPHPVMMVERGLPHPVMVGGSPRPGMGYPPTQTWDRVPSHHSDLEWSTPHPDLGWGTPPPRPGTGYPPTIQTWDGVPPIQTWDGVPPIHT